MVISFRVSTVAALAVGLLVGIFVGAIGAQQIAKHWPESDLFDRHPRFPAPSPMTFGTSAPGVPVLCDIHGFAYELVDYGYGQQHDEQTLYRAWLGFQELDPLLEKSVADDSVDTERGLHLIREAQQKKCQ